MIGDDVPRLAILADAGDGKCGSLFRGFLELMIDT